MPKKLHDNDADNMMHRRINEMTHGRSHQRYINREQHNANQSICSTYSTASNSHTNTGRISKPIKGRQRWQKQNLTTIRIKWFETWIYTCTLFEKNTPVSSALIWLFVLGIFSKDLTTFSGPIQAIQVLKYFWKFRLFFTNQNIVRTSNYFMLTISHLCKYCPCLFSQTFWVYILGSSNHPVYRHWDSISWLQIYIFVEDLTIILQPKILLELLVLHQSRTTQCQPKHLLNLLDCFKQPHKHRQNIQSNQRTAMMAKAKPHHHQNQVVWNMNLHMYFVWEKYTRK